MRRSVTALALILVAMLCVSFAAAEDLPDYQKILKIRVSYQGSTYTVISDEVAYGTAPNLNLRSGNLNGAILGSGGKELKTFSLKQPGTAYGDILGPEGEDSLTGYTETPASGEMTITIPYMADMQQLVLSDAKSGTVLLTADLSKPVSSFCSEYSQDPDCLVRPALSPAEAPSGAPAPNAFTMQFLLATIFSGSVMLAALLTIWNMRRNAAASQVPKKETVLIVDDDPDIVEIIHIVMEKRGFATFKAFSGQECLRALRDQIPDMIFLDVMMEPMDGWQTLEEIKRSPDFKNIPVLMLTGKSLTAEEAQKYRICIHDYLMKPFRIEELNAAVDQVRERQQKLKDSLILAKKAGVEKEKFCELAMLSRRTAVNKKIVSILNIPQPVPMQADLDTLDDMLVVDYIKVKTDMNEKRIKELTHEINTAFRSKGLPEFTW